MKASHIYINPQGVPCAPTNNTSILNKYQCTPYELKLLGFSVKSCYEDLKRTAIPIREEDREYMWQKLLPFHASETIGKDMFYPTNEPYEFEVHERIESTGHLGNTKNYAFIIRPSEPKEKIELLSKEQFESPENQNRDNAIVGYRSVSEPKADPKEKELYSIKPLEWWVDDNEELKALGVDTIIGDYMISECDGTFEWRAPDQKWLPCGSIDDGKRQAQDHFNSKLKLCLNREL